MNKDKINAVIGTFEANPEAEFMHLTSDGQCFTQASHAANHAKDVEKAGGEPGYIKVYREQIDAIKESIENLELQEEASKEEAPETPAAEEETPGEPAQEETPEVPAQEETPGEPAQEETPEVPAQEETPEVPSQKETEEPKPTTKNRKTQK